MLSAKYTVRSSQIVCEGYYSGVLSYMKLHEVPKLIINEDQSS